jgi:hypothetical protein
MNALFNLSKLSVWWLRLGIAIERIKPGHPRQNGNNPSQIVQQHQLRQRSGRRI